MKVRAILVASGTVAIITARGVYGYSFVGSSTRALPRNRRLHHSSVQVAGIRPRATATMTASAHGDGSGKTVASAATVAVPVATADGAQHSVAAKVGVLLLNLGGPERAEDVEGFLYNLFADPDIIRLPALLSVFQAPIAKIISSRRAPKSKAAYESIGGGSPIVMWTRAQARGIEEGLRARGVAGARVYVAMRYWHPFTEEALREMEGDGVNTLVVLPLYPQFSISTSGSSMRVLREAFLTDLAKWGPAKLRHTVVPAWYDRPGYVRAVGRLIRHEIEQYSAAERAEGVTVLFSAHGVPQSYIEAGDPYKGHIEECVGLIRKEYADCGVKTELSYQSRVGPIEWLRPYTEDKVVELGKAGVKNLVVVPISFVSEHIETLEEIDIEYRELAEENGIEHWRRVPALNTDPAFLEDMADLCLQALQEPSVSLSEACSQNNVDLGGDPLAQAMRDFNTRNKLVGIFTFGTVLLDAAFGKGIAHLFGIPL
eukprot:TRINITY_DN3233_c0_g1_i1.p1 TRINITY_DN3233_c0_g1~~TRINITY_DN3233_c0_g1_i1.p1  ORF type:complete len:486 (-),score=166.94 TRINITY_DN3233_c0_g1_i1:11-1468(-)